MRIGPARQFAQPLSRAIRTQGGGPQTFIPIPIPWHRFHPLLASCLLNDP